MNQRHLQLVRSALAALSQPKTHDADVAYAKQLLNTVLDEANSNYCNLHVEDVVKNLASMPETTQDELRELAASSGCPKGWESV